ESEITLKVTGHQWYWSYEYVEDNLEFDANLIPEEELNDAQLRLMTTDNPVYLPVGKNIRIQTIASDVLHSWSVPSLGVKMDSVPGRLNEVWTHINEPGTYYGFCSELCGVRHAYMPIMIVAVPENEYNRWLSRAKSEFAKTGTIPKLQDDETAAQLASTR
ncbi:MAG: cytochrome c oxidase subunit II, partial [Alphaproteobacteria bacterium]|nr:cytochrome c oxidase subunit II [Alphaproteobacteria bacterium]